MTILQVKMKNPIQKTQNRQFSKDNQIPPTQTFTVDTNAAKNPLESLKSDTGCTSRQQLPVHTDADEKHQQIRTLEDVKQDTEAQHLTKDAFEETTPTLVRVTTCVAYFF